jgi:ribosomal protein L37AE/L43A
MGCRGDRSCDVVRCPHCQRTGGFEEAGVLWRCSSCRRVFAPPLELWLQPRGGEAAWGKRKAREAADADVAG